MSTSSEATQACSPTPDRAADISRQDHSVLAGELSPVRFGRSRRLWQIELAIYLALFFFAALAVSPFLLTSWYWSLILLVFVALIGWHLRRSWHSRQMATRMIFASNSRWYLRDAKGEQEIILCDEILLWPQIILLPARMARGDKQYLVFTPDAMEADDWRRLRVWLRFNAEKNAQDAAGN